MSSSTPINRRALFRLGAGVGLGLAAAPLLTACGDGGTTAKAEAKSASLLPHSAVRNIGLKPDLEGTAAGVPQGFFSYPAKPLRATKTTPLKGAKPISAAMETFSPPPPSRGKNAAWQEIEKLLGGQVNITAVPADDYGTKFSTMVASDSLPDLFMYPESGGVDNKAAFLQAKCADLTPHLAGDAIKDYPNLAAIPKGAWQGAIFGGKLYGIPIARTGTAGAGVYRHDLFEEVGVTSLDQITDLDRFVEVCKELTRPKEDRYAIIAGVTTMLAMSAGAPNFWRLDEKTGKFTLDLETPEYRTAVETARALYKAGCYYPGTLQMSGAQKAQYTDMFKNGKGAYVYDGMPTYLAPGVGYIAAMKAINKKFDPRPFVPVGKDAVAWMDNVALQNTHISKASGDRVEEILRFADFAASPFGSLEYTLINYGVEGKDFTRDDKGNPALTKQGTQDVTVPWKFAASAVPAIFSADSEQGVRHVHDTFTKMIPMMVPDPTLQYSSPTWDSKSAGSLGTLKGDVLKDIISGRKPMSAYDQLVKDYLAKGGEKARGEFEEAFQKGKK
ncbi:extracellular solute-binding protein [Streptomyces drozdowiczii]|uniref:Extracellular solute-binding protein n=1 Tax=Streptomyces drozdowiczii TaxID=202862 RepID=A0ABY6PM66_9ACTN|nr:extracellular solute-binding protein [Streptomyces drozdowiczii]MCX0247334.1 extracellular solute-binding protein [Streptomyces drozdowiczii]UZK53259.1 extracellular solute-binding protein [Streptomyces drozdowiczii]